MDDRAAIWLDGQIVDAAAATVGLGAHSLHYGTAVFDGGRFYRGDDGRPAIFRLEDHVRRLFASARALFMELPHSPAEVVAASVAVARASGLGEGYVRQLAYYGDDALGIGADNRPHLAVLTWRPRATPGATVRVRVAGFGHGDGWIPTAKHAGFYGRSFIALREARATGCDDALFCAADGTLAEATGATLFAVHGGVLHTPPLSAPILPGVTRATLLELARLDGIPTREGPLPRHRALAADELFLAISAAELRPIAALDGRPFAAPGPITARLQRRYADAVRGRIPELRGWLTIVGEI